MTNQKLTKPKTIQSAFILMIAIALILTGCGAGNKASNKDNGASNGSQSSPNTGTNNGGEKPASKSPIEILNVSYDPTRELYDEYNQVFAKHWLETTGQTVKITQSHGGSGKQGRSVIDGLKADVVTLALGYDIDEVASYDLISSDWQQQFEYNSSPYTSTIVFLVRSGNPKGIKDWDDLVKPGIEVITPNPKTSGGARWNYLAAWGYALKHNNNDEAKAEEFLGQLFKNVPVLDTGARGSTTTFVERGIGDVLLAWENEAFLSIKEFGEDKFDIVVPSISILAEPPVAIVDKNVEQKNSREVSEAYLEFLYTEEAQRIIGKHFYRPSLPSIAAEFKDQFPEVELLTIDGDFGGWQEAQAKHFADEGTFDKIYTPGS